MLSCRREPRWLAPEVKAGQSPTPSPTYGWAKAHTTRERRGLHYQEPLPSYQAKGGPRPWSPGPCRAGVLGFLGVLSCPGLSASPPPPALAT